MRMMTLFALIAAAGCCCDEDEDDDNGAAIDLDATVKTYAEQALRADQTKTHATGEHPVAQAEMRRCAEALRDQCKTDEGKAAVRKAVDGRIESYDRARKIAPPGGAMEDAEFKWKAVQGLKQELGL